jgi:hypothetical protein
MTPKVLALAPDAFLPDAARLMRREEPVTAVSAT